MAVDLHLHTHHSDGSWSPAEVVQAAIRLKLRHIAITDHDTTAGLDEAREAAADHIEIISGIEINTVLPRTGADDFDVHILGYFIDPANPALLQIIERQQQARLRLVDDAAEKLQSLGVPLTREIIQECAGKGSIGRPHITHAIVKVGGAGSITEAYERFSQRNSPDYIARYSVSPQDAIEAIHSAGGISSIAHPGKGAEVAEVISLLKIAGLDAIEAYHRSHSLSAVKHNLKLARTKGMLITGGSDCHGPSHGYPASIGSVRVPVAVLQNLKSAHSPRAVSTQ